MPRADTAKVKMVMAQGLRGRGRRPRKAGSAVFSIPPMAETPSADGPRCVVVSGSRGYLVSTDPLVPTPGWLCFQLKFPDLRLRADEGR